MPEEKNTTQENAEQAAEQKPELSADASSVQTTGGDASSGGMKPKLKKLVGYGKAVLDYIDEELPEPPEKASKPKTGLGKKWDEFNAFLDSLEPPAKDAASDVNSDEGSAEAKPCGRKCFLRKSLVIAWTTVFLASILGFLFAETMLATYHSMDYVKEHKGTFYPDREIMKHLAAEHESLEAAADRISGEKDDIAVTAFDAKTVELLNPEKIYSDEYGVYIMTSDTWYGGEHGIFIAKDAANMREDLIWGIIAGRVFTYAIFD